MYKLNEKFTFFTVVNLFYYLLLYLFIIYLVYYIIECNLVLSCDSIDSSTQLYFVDGNCDKPQSHSKYNDIYNWTSPRYNDHYYSIMIEKYKIVGKRKISWFIFEKDKGNYVNYKDYKKSWDPKIDILSEMKKRLKNDLDKTAHNININKRMISWFFKGSRPGGGRGL